MKEPQSVQQKEAKSDLQQVEQDLLQHFEEPDCLHQIAVIADEPNCTLDILCQKVVQLIRANCTCPDITCARIYIDGKEFKTENYRESAWKQSSDMKVRGVKRGGLEVNYLEKKAESNEEQLSVRDRGFIKKVAAQLAKCTERKLMEQALHEGEERYRLLSENYASLIRNIPVAVYCCLPEETATMIFASDRWKDWTGYSPKDLYKDPHAWPKCVHPEDLAIAVQKFIDAYQEKSEYIWEYRIIHRHTGKIRHVMDNCAPVIDEEGNIIRFDGILTDITERKLMEQALCESKDFSSNLLSYSPNPMIVINPDTSIKYVNPAFEKLTGFRSSKIINAKTPYPWWRGTTYKIKKKFLKMMDAGGRRLEEPFQKKNGKQFWADETYVPMKIGNQLKYCLLTWNDATEQRELRENILYYARQITRAQEKERKRIARELHDDTLQALSSLCINIGEILVREEQEAKVFERLKQVRRGIEGIAEELRRFSHDLRPGLLDNLGLIASLELLCQEMEVPGSLKAKLVIDGTKQRLSSEVEVLLFRIAQEALHNIRKHSNAADAIVRINFTKQKVRLDITDDGCGFKIPKALSKLARCSKLGLMGIEERARIAHGNFKLKSKLGKGTMVTVEIPGWAAYSVT